jgi:UDP-glucose 4-epimerase
MKWYKKVVLVTGGAGFIGSHLIGRLAKYGATVFVVDDFSTGKKHVLQNIQCKIVDSNVVSINQLKGLDSPDFIFHLGAPSSDVLFRENTRDCLLNTINGFIEVIKFAKKHQVEKLIYPSSSSVYGRTPAPQSENSPTLPTNLYGVAKLICENIARMSPDVKSVGLRLFAGYGPGEENKGKIASVVTIFLSQILHGRELVIFGDGSQKRDFIYIDSIIDAMIASAEPDIEGIINVGAGEAYSFKEIINLLTNMLGKQVTPTFMPKPKGYFDITEAEVSKMENVLGISPITLKDGLEKYIQLINEAHALKSPHIRV